MAISKVVYGTTVLVDLTSDTVDAAHLAKGRTAHDAGGNLIVGILESQTDSNLLSGVTPSLSNGATKSGKTYAIPTSNGEYVKYMEYKLDLPMLTSDTLYRISLSGGTTEEGKYCTLSVKINYLESDGNASFEEGEFVIDSVSSSRCADVELASGVKVTGLEISSYPYQNNQSSTISNITLNAFAG